MARPEPRSYLLSPRRYLFIGLRLVQAELTGKRDINELMMNDPLTKSGIMPIHGRLY